jgi:Flp pilus assembly protein TadG
MTDTRDLPHPLIRPIRHRQLACESGQSLVELALTLPILLALILGAAEVGRIAYASIEIANAARAGAGFAVQNSVYPYDTTDITAAVAQEAPDLTSVQALATPACYCSSGGSFVCADVNSTTCASTDHYEDFVTVTVTGKMNTLFGVPGIPSSLTLTSSATMRLLED